MIDKSKFKPHPYNKSIFCDFDISEHFDYSINRVVFPYFDSLSSFLKDKENENINIYLTDNIDVANFEVDGNDFIVNVDKFIAFCDKLYCKGKGRVKAFFGQHLSLSNVTYNEDERSEFIKANLTEKDLLDKIKTLSEESQKLLIDTIIKLKGDSNDTSRLVSSENFIKIFTGFLKDGSIQNSVLQNLPKLQIETLESLKSFVKDNLNQNEIFFQNWIDEEKGKYRKQRCLIFGIEYIDPKREGEIMGRKRFDILATQNSEYHVLIELKSPNAEIFEIEKTSNLNEGFTNAYKLSKDLSRAIPQILGYKKWYGQLNSEKIKELGINKKKEVSDCIIVIGKRKTDDEEWKENFELLKKSITIKIWTYDDLIDKMENTIQNLKENL